MRRSAGRLLCFAEAALLTCGWSSPARAYEAEVAATTDAQFYTLRSPYGDPVVRRRRYTQTLALHVFDIQGDHASLGPSLTFKARLRLDADFAKEGDERDPRREDRFVPGLREAPVDVMYAYLEGNHYFGGLLGFRAGRQYVSDSLGWWSFDGGMLRLTTPVYFQVEAYGGFEQRGGLPIMLGTERFTSDGVYRGDRGDLEYNQYPFYLEQSELAPAYGFALESAGVHWAHGRLSYRKVINRDRVLVSPFADAGGGLQYVSGDRVSSERLGYSMRLNEDTLGAVRGSLVYDFYSQIVSERALALDWYTTERVTLGAEYDYYYPTFDGDSIFNWFSHEGMTTLQARAEWRPGGRFDVAATGGIKVFETEGVPGSYAAKELAGSNPNRDKTGRLTDGLGRLSGRYRWSDGSVRLAGMTEAGERGHRIGGDATGAQTFDNGLYDTLLVLSLYDWEDALRPDRSATSVTYVAGGGVSPFEETRLGVEWEHTTNRLVGQRYRLLATVDFTLLK